MIEFKETRLSNGLSVIAHHDPSTPWAVCNVLYKVGSKDEDPSLTGFAHLFEHLMFGGSKNAPRFDEVVQQAGGTNNAFTSPDITSYYISLPKHQLETALWLESDRMFNANLSNETIEVQKKVVVEEFRQRYLNQPYGDAWLLIRDLAYKKHPYRWATIGKEIAHIENATTKQVHEFHQKWYKPSNAILVVGSSYEPQDVFELAEKWFGGIKDVPIIRPDLPQEPLQPEARFIEVTRPVPQHCAYWAFPICDAKHEDYYALYLWGSILGEGKSSRLYKELVDEKSLFTQVAAFALESFDPGLFVFFGMIHEAAVAQEAIEAFEKLIFSAGEDILDEYELQKVKNTTETHLVSGQVELLDRVLAISESAALGQLTLLNQRAEKIQAVTVQKMKEVAAKYLVSFRKNLLKYTPE